MMFDFDESVERRNTHSDKWDSMQARYGVSPDDGLAMWVADTDFRAPEAVRQAVAEAAEHGVFGYFGDNSDYLDAIQGWMQRRHGWQVEPSWVTTTPGLVSAVGICLRAYSDTGDGVIVFTPVYHAFARVIKANRRESVESPLTTVDGRYRMDLGALEAQLTGRERIVLLCSPHNPGGTVWTAEEIRALAAFCDRHDLVLVSDEVHQDLVYPGHDHVVTPLAAPDFAGRMVVLAAPSKTFNIAGATNGMAIIADAGLRGAFVRRLKETHSTQNSFGMLMTTAAYRDGESWLEGLLVYLARNAATLDAGLNAIPGIRSMKMEATFLSWVDFSGTGLAPEEVADRVGKRAKIAANRGHTFGLGGENFMRFNIGCTHARVEDAVDRLQAAFSDLR